MKKCKRKKLFFGALIGAGVNLLTSWLNGNAQQEIADRQFRFQKEQAEKQEQLRKDAVEQNYYAGLNANSNVYNELRKSLASAKYGGKFKRCKKHKADFGTFIDNNFDTNRFLSDVFQSIGTAGASLINAKTFYNTELKKLENDKYIAELQNNRVEHNAPNYSSLLNAVKDRTNTNDMTDAELQLELQKRRNKYAKSLYLS